MDCRAIAAPRGVGHGREVWRGELGKKGWVTPWLVTALGAQRRVAPSSAGLQTCFTPRVTFMGSGRSIWDSLSEVELGAGAKTTLVLGRVGVVTWPPLSLLCQGQKDVFREPHTPPSSSSSSSPVCEEQATRIVTHLNLQTMWSCG